MKYQKLCDEIITKVGGRDNVLDVSHCITRLRFHLKDESLAQTNELKATKGVVDVIQAGGQYQVVIGATVEAVYNDLVQIGGFDSKPALDIDEGDDVKKGDPFSRLLAIISEILQPVLGVLMAGGFIKSMLALCTVAGWLAKDSNTYVTLSAIGDSVFYYFPLIIGWTSAKKFGLKPVMGMALGGILVYPTLVALMGGDPLYTLGAGTVFESNVYGDIFGIPLIMQNYSSTILPAIFIVWMGVRTESWTAGRSGLEVRMYSREKVELFLLATEDGMGPTAAAKFAGVSVGAAKKWATGHLPHSYTGARCRIGARKPPRKEASLGPDKSIYAPPATGPLAGLNEDQIENLLLRAVLADLKAEGWDPASISNRSKCELGERLRRATALPLRSITGFLRISKSSYEYWRPRVAVPRDRDADIRGRVVRIFREGSGCWGYRTVWARLRREGVRASEKRVARVMREEGLEVVYNKRRARGYSSYAGEVSKAPENLVNRRFPRRRAQPAVAHRC